MSLLHNIFLVMSLNRVSLWGFFFHATVQMEHWNVTHSPWGLSSWNMWI